MRNAEVSVIYKQGMLKGCFYSKESLCREELVRSVNDKVSQQPVIVIADDVDSALKLHDLFETTIKGKVEVLTELNQIGDIDLEDKFYMKAKSKLNKLKKEERIVLIIAKEASRGVDFQFKPGTPPAHIVIVYPIMRTSELRQAIGRSCR